MILLLSGPIAVGKTSLRDWLVSTHGYRTLSSSSYLREMAAGRDLTPTRFTLQELGDALDLETDFRWVVDSVVIPAITASPTTKRWLFDSVRKRRQLEHFRATFAESILHLHLTASEKVLRERFEARRMREGHGGDAAGYESASSHPNELEARSLHEVADLVVSVEGTNFESLLRNVLLKHGGS